MALFTGDRKKDRETFFKLLEELSKIEDPYGPKDRKLPIDEQIKWMKSKFREVERRVMDGASTCN